MQRNGLPFRKGGERKSKSRKQEKKLTCKTPEVSKVTLKSNVNKALSDDFFKKGNLLK
jgi:hypothetical protein